MSDTKKDTDKKAPSDEQTKPELSTVTSIQPLRCHESLANFSQEQQIKTFINNNIKFSETVDKKILERNAQGQHPAYFLLTCVDSRLTPNALVGMDPGNILIHRNIANTCFQDDIPSNAAITFAVEILKIKNLIVMGHQDCSGLIFSMTGNELPYMGSYLTRIREVYEEHQEELDEIKDTTQKHIRLAEFNAIKQAQRMLKHPCVVTMRKKEGWPKVYAMVYHFSDGLLHDLKVPN